jgi:membrane protein DedA with SNARE-associated domain/rhodanese-related sulfurtransferase
MNDTIEFLVRHGATVLFAAVFIEQVGVPLPAAPWLLAAGALAGAGRMNGFAVLAAASLGSVMADMIWFRLGRHYGNRILGLLCRISLEPDTCVRRTQGIFTRYGMKGVVVAKFIPGLSTLAPPLAGSSGVTAPRFLFYDGLSSLLYTGAFIAVGIVFSRQLEQVIDALAGLGRGALAVVSALIAIYIGYRYFQRRRVLNDLRMARITVDELHQRVVAGDSLLILDLRSPLELEQDPTLIRGAYHVTMDELRRRQDEIPRDRDIVLYCDCPNEVSSARMALRLRQEGITRVRPLLGGIAAWRERNYPTELQSADAPSLPVARAVQVPVQPDARASGAQV